VYDAVVALKNLERERPIREADVGQRYDIVAAQAQEEQQKIMEQEAALARELRDIGDGTESIIAYAERLESSLETNVLSLRKQKLLATPIEIYQVLTHVEVLDLAQNRITELPAEICLMSKMKKLYLDHNKLTKLPHELYKLGQTLTLLGISDNPLDNEIMQLYYTGLPVLLAHLKSTRPRRNVDSQASQRSAQNDLSMYDLFNASLPHYTAHE